MKEVYVCRVTGPLNLSAHYLFRPQKVAPRRRQSIEKMIKTLSHDRFKKGKW